MARLDITPGRKQEDGRLTAVCDAGYNDKHGHHMWEFKCDCGNTKFLPASRVFAKKPDVKSCGCIASERFKKMHANGELDHVKWKPGETCPTKYRWMSQMRTPDGRFAPPGYASKRIIRFDGGSI